MLEADWGHIFRIWGWLTLHEIAFMVYLWAYDEKPRRWGWLVLAALAGAVTFFGLVGG